MVIVLERVPASLRGELSKWLLEPKAGVFVGQVSAMVRDRLWARIEKSRKAGGALMIHRADTEQGFTWRSCGDTTRTIRDFDGLLLVQKA